MTPLLVNGLAFIAVFLGVFAANALLVDLHSSERKRVRKRMEDQFRQQQRERARTTPLPHDFSKIAADARAENEKKKSFGDSLRFMIEQSGVEISVARLLTLSTVSGLFMGLTAFFTLGNEMLAGAAFMMGAVIPVLYISYKRRQRIERLREQLPDAFDLMSRVLRAGQTVTQAMQAVAEEFSRPLSLEFLYCYEQMNLGLAPEAALKELGRRTGLLEVKIFVLAVVVHRQTGGNMAELLDKLAHTVRERFRIGGMIRSLTAQGRFQAAILLSLPPFMFALLMILHREYEMILLQNPLMIISALTMMGMGWLWIRKIINFDY